MKSQTSIKKSSQRRNNRCTRVLKWMPLGKIGHAALATGVVFVTAVASPGATTISYEGYQINVETTANDPTFGWRNPTPAKPLDIDGDNILGSDGYYAFASAISKPSYISSWAVTASAINWATSFGWADNPADPSGPDTLNFGRWASGTGEAGSLFNFVITGSDLADEVMTVGILYGTWADSPRTFELRQTVGGSATAITPALAIAGGHADVVYFNVTGASAGDKFVVISDAQILGFTFDTAAIPEPSAIALLGLAGLSLLLRRRR